MRIDRTLLTVLTLAALALVVGCGNVTDPLADGADGDADKRTREVRLRAAPDWLGPGEPPDAVPDTPDALVDAFVRAHDSRDPELLDRILHAEYQFVKQVGTTWSRAAEVSILTKMMVGRAGHDGVVIGDMVIETFAPITGWNAVSTSDPYFGAFDDAVSRPYQLQVDYALEDQDLVLRVQGLVTVYAVPAGDTYALLGMVDMTYGQKNSNDVAWTTVKALFE